jgi:hypothetical protein
MKLATNMSTALILLLIFFLQGGVDSILKLELPPVVVHVTRLSLKPLDR